MMAFMTVNAEEVRNMAVADKLTALRIKVNLIADRRVGLMEINTDVHDGIAVLTGEVETEEQKQVAEELAYEVEGIEEVDNEILVIPSGSTEAAVGEAGGAHMGYGLAEGDVGDTTFDISGAFTAPGPGLATTEQFPGQFTDEEIEEEVKDKLDSQDEIDVTDIEFSSTNQIVHLTGVVNTPDDLNLLQDMVMNVRGVMGVTSDITVREGEIGTPTD